MTTNSIHNAFINALLADTTYVDRLTSPSGIPLVGNALSDALEPRLTPTLAKYLSDNFEVVTQKLTNDITESGFDATVWRGKVNTPDAGKVFVSMRGTEFSGPADLAADIDLTAGGLARAQVIDMVNWWLKSTTSATALASQVKIVTPFDLALLAAGNSVGTIVAAPPVQGDGSVANAGTVTVNGHSLGGHLATAFSRIFGGSFTVGHTYTYNSANFNPLSPAKFAQIATALGTGPTDYPSETNDTNFYAVNGPDATAQNITRGQIGLRVPLFNEETPFASFLSVPNHYMYKLTDLLALGAALEKLDSSMTFAKLNELIKPGSNVMAGSYEGVLDGLLKALVAPNVDPIPAGDSADSATSRVRYHEAIAALLKKPSFTSLEGKLIIKTSSGNDLKAAARENFSALVALQDLSPLMLGAINPAASTVLNFFLEQSRPGDYAAWQADKSMSLADRQLGKETACSPIQNVKAIKKALPGVSVSCRHKRCSEKDTINSVAACARKQGAVATFDGQKWPDKCRKHSQQVKPQKSQLQRIAANDTLTGSVT